MSTFTYTIDEGSLSEPGEASGMAAIASMAELEAIPPGHMVRVDTTDWVRTENGLSHDGIDLRLFYFEGRVNAGAVADPRDAAPEVGEWWAGQTRTYYITYVDDRIIYYMAFRNGQVVNYETSSRLTGWSNSPRLHRIAEVPEGLRDQVEWIVHYGDLAHRLRESERLCREARTQAESVRREAQVQARKPDTVRRGLRAIQENLNQIVELMEE